MNINETFLSMIKRHEGFRGKAYFDTLNILTIGYGRNLRDPGLTEEESSYLLVNDIARITKEVLTALPWTQRLDQVRFDVLIDMGFMGVPKLLKFKKMLAALERGDYEQAAKEMLNSKWAWQVGDRDLELAEMMRGGKYVH